MGYVTIMVTSVPLSVGQAIQSAVTRSQCLVIVATPGYIDSAITSTELHILADCILQKCSFYPVVVLAAQHSAYSLHQIKEQFSQTVGCSTQDWIFINDLSQLSSVLDRLLVQQCDTGWYGKFLQMCSNSNNTGTECDKSDITSSNESQEDSIAAIKN